MRVILITGGTEIIAACVVNNDAAEIATIRDLAGECPALKFRLMFPDSAAEVIEYLQDEIHDLREALGEAKDETAG